MAGSIHLPKSDVPHLTGLRMLAAGLVLLLHLDQVYGNEIQKILTPISYGHLGVDIFFILGGLIIAHVYGILAKEFSVTEYGRFIWLRFARLYPVHLFSLVLLFVMVSARGLLDTNFWDTSTIPCHLLLIHAWCGDLTWNLPAWSISAEWLAYLAFPAVALLVFHSKNVAFPVGLVLGGLVAFELFVSQDVGVAKSFLGVPALVQISVEFSIGVLVYGLVQRVNPSWYFDVVAVLSFAVVFFVGQIPDTLRVLTLVVFVGSVALSDSFVKRVLAWRPIVFLGHASYAVYMIHFPIIKLIQNFNFQFGFEYPGLLVASFLVAIWVVLITVIASFLYVYYERPAQFWLRARWPGHSK